MYDIISKLSDIENASNDIIAKASQRKQEITKEMEKKQEDWDIELAKSTKSKLRNFQNEVQQSISDKLRIQKTHSEQEITQLHLSYEKYKAKYLDTLFAQMVGE